MTPAELKKTIKYHTAAEFNSKFLFDTDAWYFDPNNQKTIQGTYEDFRNLLGKALVVRANSIFLIGSAKFGVSLSPESEKSFTKMRNDSDLDVVVVDDKWFEEIWENLRLVYYNGYKAALNKYARHIFRKFVYLTQGDAFNSLYLRDQIKKVDELGRTVSAPLGIRHSINFRIYSNKADVLAYHDWSIEQLKDSIK